MSQRSKQSLRGLTLTVLVPCLLFSAALSGLITYRDLYRVILNDGFQQKLVAVSTGVAAFIDPDAHVAMSRATRLAGLAGDATRPILWGLDAQEGRLVVVDMATGCASPSGDLPSPGLVGLAYDVPTGMLITVRPSSGEVLAFFPGSTTSEMMGRIEPGAHALALDASATHLVAAGPWGLRGYAFARSRDDLTPLWTAEIAAQAVALSPQTGALYALDRTGHLLVADSVGAPLRVLGQLAAGDEEADLGQFAGVQALATSPLVPTLFGAGTRLMAISPQQLTFEVERFRRGYRNEEAAVYGAYAEPMRRIRNALDLTYLYTQNVVPGDSIQYIVDSTPEGEGYSPIGSREALETEADIRGLADVMERGLVYSSKIEDSEEWGLLKSAYAPISGRRGDAVGMVGTDISVSTIRDRTQLALAKVGLVTVVILFLGGLGSIAISLRLTGPLSAVQEGATRVAAGRVGEPITPPRLRDLCKLTDSFNEMTRTLTSTVDALREETRQVESIRTRKHLTHELAARVARDGLPAGVTVECPGGRAGVPVPAGFVVVDGPNRPLTVVWVRPGGGDPFTTLAEHEEFALLVRRTAGPVPLAPEELVAGLERFWDQEGGPFLVVDSVAGRVWSSSRGHPRAIMAGPEGREEPFVLTGGQALQVPCASELAVLVAEGDAPREGPLARPGCVVRVKGASG